MMIDVHVIRSAFLLGLCLRAGALSAAPPVYEPVLADGGTSAVLRLPGDLGEVPRHRLTLEKAPPAARLSRDGTSGTILRWPVPSGAGTETEIVLVVSGDEDPDSLERHRLRVRWGGQAPAPDAVVSRLVPDAAPLSARVVAAGPSAVKRKADGRAEWRSRPSSAPTRGSGLSGARAKEVRPAPARASVGPASRRGNAAPQLGRIGAQRLVVGRRWQLHVRVRDADGDEPVFFTAGLPETATFERSGDGWLVLGWTPTEESVGRVDVTLGVADGRDARLRTERVVRLEVQPAAGGADVDAAPDDGATAVPASAPLIEPLAAHVVSTGRTVSFRVVARLEDGRRPHLLIDRLPSRAGFYENLDGSRTFHWPTEKSDQGEHLFGITAVHPDDDALRSHVETLVIVGDPTLARTTPSEPISPFGVATLERTNTADEDGTPYYAPPEEVYWSDPSRVERYAPDIDEGYGEAGYDETDYGVADYGEPDYGEPGYGGEEYSAGAYDADGFLPENGYSEESGYYPENDAPFEDAAYFESFDYTDEEPDIGYAHPDDGREYFLGADGVAVDADGNPVGEFRFEE